MRVSILTEFNQLRTEKSATTAVFTEKEQAISKVTSYETKLSLELMKKLQAGEAFAMKLNPRSNTWVSCKCPERAKYAYVYRESECANPICLQNGQCRKCFKDYKIFFTGSFDEPTIIPWED